MTKQLLTALLIAGLSATAKAEPVVYYCNTTAFAQVYGDNSDVVKSYPLKLFIERHITKSKIKIASDEIWDLNLDASKETDSVYLWPTEYGDDAFWGNNDDVMVDFRNGVLAYTTIGTSKTGELMASAYVASCEKF